MSGSPVVVLAGGTGGAKLARGLLITIAVGCLLNSLLMDHVEGLFFAWATGLLFAGLNPQAEKNSMATP